MSILDTKIEFLKGVGPKRAKLLNQELSIYLFQDLLTFFPYRYVDRSKYYKISDINTYDVDVQLIVVIKSISEKGVGRKRRLMISCFDDTGSINLVFFKGFRWLRQFIQPGVKCLIFGKPTKYVNQISFIHPEIEILKASLKRPTYSLFPIYHSTEKLTSLGLNSKGISKLTFQLLSVLDTVAENLNLDIIKRYHFISRKELFNQMHFPSNKELLDKAIYRFKFEELFFLQITILKQKISRRHSISSFVFKVVGEKFNHFYSKHLHFELTNAQKKVMKEIRSDFLTGHQMNRLLQGDVGSGKTIISFMSILLAHDNGFQSCLMAPTEILAHQHFAAIQKFAVDIGLRVVLLTGKMKQVLKDKIRYDLKNNLIDVVIGTHAIIQDNVFFAQLGLVVIDEQHKFGVSQRSKLYEKYPIPPHVLVMTATPIPRTLAMTAYGDLDVSIIDELPPNRKHVKTSHFYDKDVKKVFEFLHQELLRKKQVYIVYPLIEKSEALDYKNLMSGYENIKAIFHHKGFQISMVHGRLKQEEKSFQMEQFIQQKTQIMVATTVIEVGVNIPNATVMVIQNADKFGLSQLHQLRGRVGRGNDQSHCFLLTSNKLSADAKERINAMVDHFDGFQVAEIDLNLRGPGDVLGTRQSGLLNLKLSSLVKDHDILTLSRSEAKQLLHDDPDLINPSNIMIRNHFFKYHSDSLKWGSVA